MCVKNVNTVMNTQWLKFIYNGQVKGSFTQATKKSDFFFQFGQKFESQLETLAAIKAF